MSFHSPFLSNVEDEPSAGFVADPSVTDLLVIMSVDIFSHLCDGLINTLIRIVG